MECFRDMSKCEAIAAASDLSLHCLKGLPVPILRVITVFDPETLRHDIVNDLKFCTPKLLTKRHIQTVQILIRLLLIRIYMVCNSTKYFKKQLCKKLK